MDTDTLIRTLALDPKVRGPRMSVTLGLCVAGMLTYTVLAVLVVAGARPDFGAHVSWVAAKAGLSLLYALAAAPLLLRLAKPGGRMGVWAPLLAVMLVACAATVGYALATTAGPERMTALTGGTFPICTLVIPTLAAPAAAVLFLWLRKQAPTQPVLAGLAAGILSGALAATAYALTCPVDTMAFVATFYPLAIAACAGFGAVAGAFALRW